MVLSPDPVESDRFDPAWDAAESVPGWLTRGQGRELWDAATALAPGSTMVEIGSHQGRSTIVLARALQHSGGTVVAIDPFVEGRLFGGLPTRTKFEDNIQRSGVAGNVRLVPDFSTKQRPEWTEPFACLYIDGKHDYWTLSDDLKWTRHLSDGGVVLIHDCYSSIGVTLGILRHVLTSTSLRYEHREGSLAVFRKTAPRFADRLRILAELPWWIRNVGLKMLLRLRLRPVARFFGHDSPYDPY